MVIFLKSDQMASTLSLILGLERRLSFEREDCGLHLDLSSPSLSILQRWESAGALHE